MADVNIYSGYSVPELIDQLKRESRSHSDRVTDITTVIETVARINSGKGNWLLTGKPCPKCSRRTVLHSYELVGGAEYYDSFSHTCANPECDYSETKDLYGGQDGNIENSCPFCVQ